MPLQLYFFFILYSQVIIAVFCPTTTNNVVLNDCGVLPEFQTTAAEFVIEFKSKLVNFNNGRSINGKKMSLSPDSTPNCPYLDVIRVTKGVPLKVKMKNLQNTNVNLHTHGLHVKGNGADDMSVVIPPNQEFSYVIPIKANHASGTNWMHPHFHGKAILHIAGMGLGMLIVNDEPNDVEVPKEIRTAQYFNLILQHHNGIYGNWTEDDGTNNFYTVNGFASNPTLKIPRNKWIRLRILHVSIAIGKLAKVDFTLPNNISCQFSVIAKDGVYLKTPRVLSGSPISLYFTEASRIDVMVLCDGPLGGEIPVTAQTYEAFKIQLSDRPLGVDPDTYAIEAHSYHSCLPSYLDDTFNNAISKTVTLASSMTFAGFNPATALDTVQYGTTILLKLSSGVTHPWHTHVNHFQLTKLATGDTWNQIGDWLDTIPGTCEARMRLIDFNETMMVHCHNLDHQDNQDMAQIVWIVGSEDSSSLNCNKTVNLTRTDLVLNSSTPTQSPAFPLK